MNKTFSYYRIATGNPQIKTKYLKSSFIHKQLKQKKTM